MQVPIDYAMGTLRFSTGKPTTPQQIDRAVSIVTAVVERLSPSLFQSPETSLGDHEGIEQIRLTQFTKGLGCACKLAPKRLEAILAKLPQFADQNVLVGTETSDDAAVYRLSQVRGVIREYCIDSDGI